METKKIGKKLFNTSLVYFFGKILVLFVTIAFLPIYTSKISTDNYGYYELLRSIGELAYPVIAMEMWSGVLRIGMSKEMKDKTKNIFSTSILFSLACLIIFAIIFLIITKFVFVKHALLIVLFCISELIYQYFCSFARVLNKSLHFAISGIVGSLANLLFGCLFVFVFNMQEEAIFVSMIIGYIIQSIYLFIVIKGYQYISLRYFDKAILKKLIRFSLPLSFGTIVYYLSRSFNKVLISSFLSTVDVALYSVAYKFMSLLLVIVGVITSAWNETVYSIDDKGTKYILFSKWTNYFAKFISVLSPIFLIFIKIVFPYLIADSYNEAIKLLPTLYFSLYFLVMGAFLVTPFYSENNTKIVVLGRSFSAIVNIGLFFILFSKFGLYAATVSFSLGLVVEYSFFHIYQVKKMKIKLDFPPIIIYFLLFGIAMVEFYHGNIIFDILFMALCAIFGLLIYYKDLKILFLKISKKK